MKFRFSIRALLILIVALSFLFVFHELAIEILIRGYWLVVATMFMFGIWMARESFSRFVFIPSLLLVPTLLGFVYASGARRIIIDPGNAGPHFQLPAVETMLDRILAFWCQFHGDGPPGSIHFELGLLETLLTVVIVGILCAATGGLMVGLILAPKRQITKN